MAHKMLLSPPWRDREGLSDGDLTAEEAAQLLLVLDGYCKAFALHDIANRVEALESRAKGLR